MFLWIKPRMGRGVSSKINTSVCLQTRLRKQDQVQTRKIFDAKNMLRAQHKFNFWCCVSRGAFGWNLCYKLPRALSCSLKCQVYACFPISPSLWLAESARHLNENKRRCVTVAGHLGRWGTANAKSKAPQQVQEKLYCNRYAAGNFAPAKWENFRSNKNSVAKGNTKKKPSAGEYSMQIGLAGCQVTSWKLELMALTAFRRSRSASAAFPTHFFAGGARRFISGMRLWCQEGLCLFLKSFLPRAFCYFRNYDMKMLRIQAESFLNQGLRRYGKITQFLSAQNMAANIPQACLTQFWFMQSRKAVKAHRLHKTANCSPLTMSFFIIQVAACSDLFLIYYALGSLTEFCKSRLHQHNV